MGGRFVIKKYVKITVAVLITALVLGTTIIAFCLSSPNARSGAMEGGTAVPAAPGGEPAEENTADASGFGTTQISDESVLEPTPGADQHAAAPEQSHDEAPDEVPLLIDTEPPVITGAEDQTVFVGSSIAYRAGVSAYDNIDGDISFTVDSSDVNIYESGDYKVIYSAVDSSGNEASVTVTISVIELNTEVVYEMADRILEGITTPEMSLYDKARNIHNWIRWNIVYSYSSEKTNTIDGAYAGFRTRQGDCFTFYAVAEVLLTRAEVPNMRVTRIGGYTAHYWNLINVGTGWYHFDATPTRERVNNFMFTSVQAEEFTRQIPQVPNYYVYDKSLYPRVVGDEYEPPDKIPALISEISSGMLHGERTE